MYRKRKKTKSQPDEVNIMRPTVQLGQRHKRYTAQEALNMIMNSSSDDSYGESESESEHESEHETETNSPTLQLSNSNSPTLHADIKQGEKSCLPNTNATNDRKRQNNQTVETGLDTHPKKTKTKTKTKTQPLANTTTITVSHQPKKRLVTTDFDTESDSDNPVPPSPNSNLYRPPHRLSLTKIATTSKTNPKTPAHSRSQCTNTTHKETNSDVTDDGPYNNNNEEIIMLDLDLPTPSPQANINTGTDLEISQEDAEITEDSLQQDLNAIDSGSVIEDVHLMNDTLSESESESIRDDPYEIETDTEVHGEQVPINNYQGDTVIPEDVRMGWERIHDDAGPTDIHSFTGSSRHYLNCTNYTPGEIFDELFEEKMWTILSENTNKYVHAKIKRAKEKKRGIDPIPNLSNGDKDDEVSLARLQSWQDTTPNEMKIWLAHLILFGILKRKSIEQYWSQDPILQAPFFGRYMSRNRFQNILWNVHVSDPDEENPKRGEAGHDPLFLVRPMIDMMQRLFKTKYRPGKQISVDESTCPFKGRFIYRCYNASKPNRFHIKLFMVSEAVSGYICGFEVYTGDNGENDRQEDGNLEEATKTSKLVIQLLGKMDLLQRGHHVYFDNYYNSPQLLQFLGERKTYGCGTVRKNRRGLPLAVTNAKLKKGEIVFRRKNQLLALKWKDKRDVYILSSLHKANNLISNKVDHRGEKIIKPEAVFLYNRYMSGVDITDQFLQYYCFLRKSVKWSRKLFIHCLNMVILNSHILHKKYGNAKKPHAAFRLEIVKHLLKGAVVRLESNRCFSKIDSPQRLQERHFISYMQRSDTGNTGEGNAGTGTLRKHPARTCTVCNLTEKDLIEMDIDSNLKPQKYKYTCYWCAKCKKAMCIEPCFELYHTVEDYKKEVVKFRIDNTQT